MAAESLDRVAAETWFLARGLPAVLTPRARWRRLWRRSAPALAGYATLVVCAAVIVSVAGYRVIDIDDDPSSTDIVVLVVLLLMVPLACVVAWLVSRIADAGRRNVASTISVVAAVVAVCLDGSPSARIEAVLLVGVVVASTVALNGLGVGSVLGWALRLTVSHLASVGALVARALPVVLLTVLVFFNGYVWSMATKISRERMWLVIAFLTVLAAAFLISGLVERVRPMLASAANRDVDADSVRLADTPFADTADPVSGDVLSRGERSNVIFVVAAAQLTQIAMIAIVTAGIFFVLGLLVLSPEVLASWTTNGPDQGTVLGMTLPVPQSLIHVVMFLGALTFMYVSARAVGDGEYRKEFLDPLVDDLRLTLVACNRYRSRVAARH